MQTNDLHRSYIAQTGIINALNRLDLRVSGDSISLRVPESRDKVREFESGIAHLESFSYNDFKEVTGVYFTDVDIQIFLDIWHAYGTEQEVRAEAIEGLFAELPGTKALVSEDDGDRIIVGVIHHTTYWLRVGKVSIDILPGRVK